MKLLLLIVALFASSAYATEKRAVPYLGPGADKLNPQDYERIYKNYIQASVLLGYQLMAPDASACDQALGAIFRQSGMFHYPVPADAQQVVKSTKKIGTSKVETYEMGGFLLQVVRVASSDALDYLIQINSSSTKASRRLVQIAKREALSLQKDPVTGLERIKGIPVGYPHPFLSSEGQGLYVKVLRFNKKKEGCEPIDFLDNTWTAGFDLSEKRCIELQVDAEAVWKEKLSADAFAEKELKRMKDIALKSAVSKGTKEAEAKKIIEKHFVPPFTNQINVVGSAMRNLAQCNLLALGRAGGKEKAPSALRDDNSPSDTRGSAGSAK